MEKKYEQAMKDSFPWENSWRLTFNKDKTIAEKFHGAQTIGIAVLPTNTENEYSILVAEYFMPSIIKGIATVKDNGLEFKADVIRSVQNGISTCRIFPNDNIPSGDGNRCQTVNYGPNNTILVTRNTDIKKEVFVLTPPEEPEGAWNLKERFLLPHDDSAPSMVHSLLVDGNNIFTIESGLVLRDTWCLNKYTIQQFDIPKQIIISKDFLSTKIPDFTYGIAKKDDHMLFITDYRATNQRFNGLERHGIYSGSNEITEKYDLKLVRPGVCGNGLGLLENGILVSVYGMAEQGPFGGQPGRIIYLPKL